MPGAGCAVAETRQLAEVCMQEHRLEEAVRLWSDAIQLDPEEASLYAERSRCLFMQKRYDRALQDAERVIELRPDCASSYGLKADLLCAVRQYQRALPAIRQCVRLSSGSTRHLASLSAWLDRCEMEAARQISLEQKWPFVAAGGGIVVATLAVVFDTVFRGQGALLPHPLLKVACIVLVSGSCYFMALLRRRCSGS